MHDTIVELSKTIAALAAENEGLRAELQAECEHSEAIETGFLQQQNQLESLRAELNALKTETEQLKRAVAANQKAAQQRQERVVAEDDEDDEDEQPAANGSTRPLSKRAATFGEIRVGDLMNGRADVLSDEDRAQIERDVDEAMAEARDNDPFKAIYDLLNTDQGHELLRRKGLARVN